MSDSASHPSSGHQAKPNRKRRVRISEEHPTVSVFHDSLSEKERSESWWSRMEYAAVKDSVKRQCRNHRKQRRFSDCLTVAYQTACKVAAAESQEPPSSEAGDDGNDASSSSQQEDAPPRSSAAQHDAASAAADATPAAESETNNNNNTSPGTSTGSSEKSRLSPVQAVNKEPPLKQQSQQQKGAAAVTPDKGLVRWVEDRGPRGLEGYSSRLHAMRRQRHLQETKHAVFLEQARQNISNEKDVELLARQAEKASRRARTFATLLGQADAWAAGRDHGDEPIDDESSRGGGRAPSPVEVACSPLVLDADRQHNSAVDDDNEPEPLNHHHAIDNEPEPLNHHHAVDDDNEPEPLNHTIDDEPEPLHHAIDNEPEPLNALNVGVVVHPAMQQHLLSSTSSSPLFMSPTATTTAADTRQYSDSDFGSSLFHRTFGDELLGVGAGGGGGGGYEAESEATITPYPYGAPPDPTSLSAGLDHHLHANVAPAGSSSSSSSLFSRTFEDTEVVMPASLGRPEKDRTTTTMAVAAAAAAYSFGAELNGASSSSLGEHHHHETAVARTMHHHHHHEYAAGTFHGQV